VQTLSPRDPHAEVLAANPWYVDEQFVVQLGSPAFRDVVENRWRMFERAIDEWLRRSGTAAPSRLLDAGCGDGINLSFLGRLTSVRRWTTTLVGIDYNTLRVRRAQTLHLSGLARSSVTALSFRDASFDIIICNHVLEHVPDDVTALVELRRVLRPGGLLIIGVPNEGSLLGMLRNLVLQRSILRTTDHVNMYTRQRLLQRLNRAQIRVERVEADGFFVPHTALHALCNRWRPIRRALNAIAQLIPACAAGLLVVATRPH
jgi:SAM-dependent methyltransferase